jgi:hypothetical protein
MCICTWLLINRCGVMGLPHFKKCVMHVMIHWPWLLSIFTNIMYMYYNYHNNYYMQLGALVRKHELEVITSSQHACGRWTYTCINSCRAHTCVFSSYVRCDKVERPIIWHTNLVLMNLQIKHLSWLRVVLSLILEWNIFNNNGNDTCNTVLVVFWTKEKYASKKFFEKMGTNWCRE